MGFDEFIIEFYKKVELGESRRLFGVNDIVCFICLFEYVSKEIVWCILECEYCFYIECIDVWFKFYGLCFFCWNLFFLVCEVV